jgi:hypothetical protein
MNDSKLRYTGQMYAPGVNNAKSIIEPYIIAYDVNNLANSC